MKMIEIKTYTNDKDVAKNIVNYLLDNNLVVCANIKEVESTYYWKNDKVNEIEYEISLKSIDKMYKLIEKEILRIHNYDLPCITYNYIDGYDKYIEWIKSSLKQVSKV